MLGMCFKSSTERNINMNEKTEYLPLGSIVIVKGGVKKYVIVARGLQVKVNGENQYFDYGACMYPEGMQKDQLMYFQHSNIYKVVFQGFSDDDDKIMVENIKETVERMNIKRADVRKLKLEENFEEN